MMKLYAMSARVLGMPVMCGTVEAIGAEEARKAWEAKFWSDPNDLRAAIPSMDGMNRFNPEQMIRLMDSTRANARRYGLVVTARLSKARAVA
jgi:hypothetical protein